MNTAEPKRFTWARPSLFLASGFYRGTNELNDWTANAVKQDWLNTHSLLMQRVKHHNG